MHPQRRQNHTLQTHMRPRLLVRRPIKFVVHFRSIRGVSEVAYDCDRKMRKKRRIGSPIEFVVWSSEQ